MRRAGLVFALAIAAAFLGPNLTSPRERPAGQEFAIDPPEGFVEEKGAGVLAEKGGREWVNHEAMAASLAPRMILIHSKDRGTVEAADLALVARSMPDNLRDSGVSWSDLRQETRTRPDGARVGLVEGDCVKKGREGFGGATAADLHYRRLNLMFPTDAGFAVVTAIYPKEQAAKWQPLFEATINGARGVAMRKPGPPEWMYVAWGGGGLVLGWLFAKLFDRGRPHEEPRPPKRRRRGGSDESSDTEEDDAARAREPAS